MFRVLSIFVIPIIYIEYLMLLYLINSQVAELESDINFLVLC